MISLVSQIYFISLVSFVEMISIGCFRWSIFMFVLCLSETTITPYMSRNNYIVFLYSYLSWPQFYQRTFVVFE